jgi:hypothetical protein
MSDQTLLGALKSTPFLSEVPPEQYFVLSNGESVKSLLELQNKLLSMDEEVFLHHVTPEKNDFAAWIYNSIGDHELAEKLGPVKNRNQHLKLVRDRVRECADKSVMKIRRKRSR